MTEEKKPRARRLQKIADWVNGHSELLGLVARVFASSVWKERRAPGLRYSFGGRRVNGYQIVFCATRPVTTNGAFGDRTFLKGEVVLDHNSAETYRCNADVERWLARFVERLPTATKKKLGRDAIVWAQIGYGW